jgi:hypothetical protein
MSKSYQPPYTITPAIIRLISSISEQLGRLSVLEDEKNLCLRLINRIRTIQGSLASESNVVETASNIYHYQCCFFQLNTSVSIFITIK